jgi:hypothetical protein
MWRSRYRRRVPSLDHRLSGSRRRANRLPSPGRTRSGRPGGGVPAGRGRTFRPAIPGSSSPGSRRGRHGSRAGAVAVGSALGRPFERGGADERGRLPLDHLLIRGFRRGPDPVGDVGEFQLAGQVKQGRLIKSNRVLCRCREIFIRFSLTGTQWLFMSMLRRSKPRKLHHHQGRDLFDDRAHRAVLAIGTRSE